MRLGMSSHVVTTASATLKGKGVCTSFHDRDLNLLGLGWPPLTMGDRRADRSRSRPRHLKPQRKMAAFKKNSGFKMLDAGLFDWVFDIGLNQHRLWLVPLARRPATNPVYAHKPFQGEYKKILDNLSDSFDHDGIMAIGALEYATIRRKDFLCARVRLKTGEQGWINVAFHDDQMRNGEWMLYLKVMRVWRMPPPVIIRCL